MSSFSIGRSLFFREWTDGEVRKYASKRPSAVEGRPSFEPVPHPYGREIHVRYDIPRGHFLHIRHIPHIDLFIEQSLPSLNSRLAALNADYDMVILAGKIPMGSAQSFFEEQGVSGTISVLHLRSDNQVFMSHTDRTIVTVPSGNEAALMLFMFQFAAS